MSCTTEVTETCAATAAPHRHAKAQYVRVRLRAPGVPNSTRPRVRASGDAQSIGKNELENRRDATASLFSEGQLEAWSTGSLPRGDNQVTRVASALGHVADADPKV